jgi:hypothetical protein
MLCVLLVPLGKDNIMDLMFKTLNMNCKIRLWIVENRVSDCYNK